MERLTATDLAELTVLHGEKVVLCCLICTRTVGEDVCYLADAMHVWKQHLEEMHEKEQSGG